MKIHENYPLAPRTYYRIGGAARWCAFPETEEQVRQLFHEFSDCPCKAAPWVMGGGANLLVSDAGYDGLVICTEALSRFHIEEATIAAQAGVVLNTLVGRAVEKNFAGFASLAGIPGSLGGGIRMNAGAFGATISDSLSIVRWYNPVTDTMEEDVPSQLSFSYRSSFFSHTPSVILSARFSTCLGSGAEGVLREDILQRRKRKQPLEFPSCGSVFKRPPGAFAGALIEEAGLKGYTCGGAQVSPHHANFIINRSRRARAEHVLSIINECRRRVYELRGILLEPEVILLGEFLQELWRPNSV
ncbi:UDP-N-acetylmuramate dehydrogenase [Chitinivibrio alkaliphilus]|uniref:UDP-N-acetylenolpyruvoylglucosamine reductase n=1 Tax=Chitinivibrio alkaliphilus ACht1 TaxID=1313304 RepID=U7D6Q6_9BACT|nr:UDP-N-acetylmuramate dehydrogenase [Chitinivibrio alkaliphilus]ERP31618.1 UDP-N-acetylenolpyruvoylglucosamine reductase [Chitinivibrio alkaliphilus ACht1]